MNSVFNKLTAVAVFMFIGISAFAQEKTSEKIEGIWQLVIPSRNISDNQKKFVDTWKIYGGDGTYTIMSNNTPTGLSMLKAKGKYTVVNDSVIEEKNEISQTGKAGKTDRIKVVFIGKELMNTYHNINSKEGIWEELWKRVSTNADDSDMEYLNTEKDNNKVSRDLDGIYTVTEKMPEYSGGSYEDLVKKVSQTVVYPEEAQEKGLEGITIIRFVVNEKGKPENLEVMRSSYPILDKEAKRVISKLYFIPGMHDGKKVKVYMAIPVNFKLR